MFIRILVPSPRASEPLAGVRTPLVVDRNTSDPRHVFMGGIPDFPVDEGPPARCPRETHRDCGKGVVQQVDPATPPGDTQIHAVSAHEGGTFARSPGGRICRAAPSTSS